MNQPITIHLTGMMLLFILDISIFGTLVIRWYDQNVTDVTSAMDKQEGNKKYSFPRAVIRCNPNHDWYVWCIEVDEVKTIHTI